MGQLAHGQHNPTRQTCEDQVDVAAHKQIDLFQWPAATRNAGAAPVVGDGARTIGINKPIPPSIPAACGFSSYSLFSRAAAPRAAQGVSPLPNGLYAAGYDDRPVKRLLKY